MRTSDATTGAARPSGPDTIERCSGCGARVETRFCGECGGQARPGRLTLRAWLAEVAEDLLSIDGRFPRTVRTLLTRPGALSRQWLEGRRAGYTSPIRLYLVFSGFFFAFTLLLPSERPVPLSSVFDEGRAAADASVTEEVERLVRLEREDQRTRRIAPTLVIAMVPLLALLLRILYRRSGVLYLEHLVFAVHLHAFAFLPLAVVWGVEGRVPLGAENLTGGIATAGFLAYAILAARRMYGEGWIATGLKTLTAVGAHAFLFAVTLVIATVEGAASPRDDLREASRAYWAAVNAESDDPAAVRRAVGEAILAHERLGFHLVTPHMRIHLGQLHLRAGQPQRALDLAREALAADPDDLLALGLAAESALAVGDSASAGTFLARFRDVDAAGGYSLDTGPARGHAPDIERYRALASGGAVSTEEP